MNKFSIILTFIIVLLCSCNKFNVRKPEKADAFKNIPAFNKDDFEHKILDGGFFIDSMSSSTQYILFLSYLCSHDNIQNDEGISEKIYNMFHDYPKKQIEILKLSEKYSCGDTLKAKLYTCLNRELWKREYKDSLSIFLEQYVITDQSLLSGISKTIIPYLKEHDYDENKVFVTILFERKDENSTWIGINVVNKEQLLLENIIGYFLKDKYLFILYGDTSASSFIGNRKKNTLLKYKFYNNIPSTDGSVSWLYILKERILYPIAFNDQW